MLRGVVGGDLRRRLDDCSALELELGFDLRIAMAARRSVGM